MGSYLPEGNRMSQKENLYYLRSEATLREAMRCGAVLEARCALCSASHDLIVDLGFCRGRIPREEGALGVKEGRVRDIALLSRVNKPVSFIVEEVSRDREGNLVPLLSRRRAQEACVKNYVSRLTPGDVIPARVTHLENFGAFVDIGCGVPSLISIDQISVSRISHPRDRFAVGEEILAVVRGRDLDGRIILTHKELLGTWEENASLFLAGETVAGVVRSVESYGVFVELTPNLAGLAEPFSGVQTGQHASVYIKSILPEKMKIKLIIVDAFDAPYRPEPLTYFIKGGHLDSWRYSPQNARRVIETVF